MVKSQNNRKKILVVALVALGVVAIGVSVFAGVKYFSKDKEPLPVGGVNYDPPTDAEKKEAEEHKKELEEQTGSTSTTSPSATTDVIITYLSVGETRGYAASVVESGGTCTLTLTKESSVVTATSSAIDDVNKSTCAPIRVDSSRLSSGTWNAVLSYSSSTASGSSATQKLEVP
ncbi:hypothetical protein KC963_04915 [Candidatus Saccharibacteria bacterium]|nr:hypothetical protein [Candidatus Saccharibacteria bacterium]